jgi:hypothetical protein
MTSTLAQSVLVVLATLTLIAVLVVLVFVVLRRGSGSTEAAGVVYEIESVASGMQELRDSVLTRLTAFQAEAQKMIEVHTNLEQMLRVPGPRGQVGEMALEVLLKDQLPEGISVFFQEEIANGKKPDAFILVEDQRICIDSKFPLDHYHNLVTAHRTTVSESSTRKNSSKRSGVTLRRSRPTTFSLTMELPSLHCSSSLPRPFTTTWQLRVQLSCMSSSREAFRLYLPYYFRTSFSCFRCTSEPRS